MKIDSITKEQWDDLYSHRDRMALFGYSTTPADRTKTEEALKYMYSRMEKTLEKVVWCDGPATAYLLSGIIVNPKVLKSIQNSNHSKEVRPNNSTLLDSISVSLMEVLGIENGDKDVIGTIVKDNKNTILSSSEITWMWGQHDLYWISYYRWCERAGLVTYKKEDSELLSAWEDIGVSCGWWWARENQVWACERPSVCRVDERGLLHSENTPSMAFKDGFELYSWHGTSVPKEWILSPKEIEPSLALTWENIEQRRALAEIIGWDKVLDQLNANVLSTDPYGELVEVDLPDAGILRFVRVRCATERTFAIPVPTEVQTALEGVAWTYQMTPEEYSKIEVRT